MNFMIQQVALHTIFAGSIIRNILDVDLLPPAIFFRFTIRRCKVAIIIDVQLHGSIPEMIVGDILHRYKIHVEDLLGDMAVDMIRAYLPTQYMYLGANGGDPY